MTGLFFEYFDGYLRVDFARARYGDIYVDFSLHGDAMATIPCDAHFVKGTPEIRVGSDAIIRTWTSSSMCCFFSDMLHWLEAVVVGVWECAFQWDGEGPEGELRWFCRDCDSGQLKLSWRTWREADVEREVRLNTPQMVRAFYESFRNYVESDRYDPLDYEDLNAGEAFSLVLEGGNLDALADFMASRSRQEALGLIHELLDLASDRDAGYPRRATLAQFIERVARRPSGESDQADGWISAEWDGWSVSQRRRDVVEGVYKGGACMGSGTKLRELRSPMVEEWLVKEAEKLPAKAAAPSHV